MKRILLVITLTVLSGSTAFSQDDSQLKAWKIVYKTRAEPLSGATPAQIKEAKTITQKFASTKRVVLFSDSLYRVDHLMKIGDKYRSTYSLIANRRDDVVYQYDGSQNAFVRQSYTSYMEMVNKESEVDLIDKQHYQDSVKTILGWRVRKMTFNAVSPVSPSDTLKNIVWYAPELPNWFVNMFKGQNLPGFPLQTVTIPMTRKKYLHFIDEAVKIRSVTLEKSDYLPPEDAEIVDGSDR